MNSNRRDDNPKSVEERKTKLGKKETKNRECNEFKVNVKHRVLFEKLYLLGRHLLVQNQLWKQQNDVSNLSKAKNKDVRTTLPSSRTFY